MTHPFPCPKCKYEGEPPVGPVWKIHNSLGWGECVACGYVLDDKLIRAKMADAGRATEHYCTHRWADTGLVKSWCSKCCVEGHFNLREGGYVVWKDTK